MLGKRWLSVLVLVAGMAGLLPAMASPDAIGSLVGSKNAVLDGQGALAHTTVLSGDQLQVNDGMALMTLDQGNRMILGRETEASFMRDANGVTVSLSRGNVSLYHPESSTGFRVQVGDVTVVPEQGYKTLGEVAMVDGLLLVTAKDGALQIEKGGTTKEVSAGKTITIATTSAGAPTPNPPGKQHLKHIGLHISNGALLFVGLAAEVGGGATAIVLATRAPKQVSPFVP